MATTLPGLVNAGIPAPRVEVESQRPCNAIFGYIPLDFPAHPDRKGNRGMAGIPPRLASWEAGGSGYTLKRGV